MAGPATMAATAHRAAVSEEGRRRILEGFLETVPRGQDAPAAWVSGFFGSGKSHLVKMARALWTNVPFATDGRTPRDIARLPRWVSDPLRELDALVRQKKTALRDAYDRATGRPAPLRARPAERTRSTRSWPASPVATW